MQIINTYPHQSFVLLIDEIHRMTKNIQDYLLPYLESGQVMLIGVTTENPIMSIVLKNPVNTADRENEKETNMYQSSDCCFSEYEECNTRYRID